MALRHRVLVSLGGLTARCELAKWFDAGVLHNGQATSLQLYGESSSLEDDGLITGTEVVRRNRPVKRFMTIACRRRDELDRFVAQTLRSSFQARRSVKREILV
jgi:DNA-binding PadR family transcriptional regulator